MNRTAASEVGLVFPDYVLVLIPHTPASQCKVSVCSICLAAFVPNVHVFSVALPARHLPRLRCAVADAAAYLQICNVSSVLVQSWADATSAKAAAVKPFDELMADEFKRLLS